MSMEWIRTRYGVPAKRGGRVEYTGGTIPQMGTIVGAKSGRLSIRLDGENFTAPYHPTWEIQYIDPPPPAERKNA